MYESQEGAIEQLLSDILNELRRLNDSVSGLEAEIALLEGKLTAIQDSAFSIEMNTT